MVVKMNLNGLNEYNIIYVYRNINHLSLDSETIAKVYYRHCIILGGNQTPVRWLFHAIHLG